MTGSEEKDEEVTTVTTTLSKNTKSAKKQKKSASTELKSDGDSDHDSDGDATSSASDDSDSDDSDYGALYDRKVCYFSWRIDEMGVSYGSIRLWMLLWNFDDWNLKEVQIKRWQEMKPKLLGF